MQRADPKAQRIARGAITVNTLLDRHLATKRDRAPGTVEAGHYHAEYVRRAFGDRVVSTLETTEIEIWSVTPGISAESRKKRVEMLRAAIKRGIRDKLVDTDPTEGIIVSLGHRELPLYSPEDLMAILEAASDSDLDHALLGVLGLLGLRSGEARSLKVGDLRDGRLSVRNGGAGTDTTKTRSSTRVLPVPATLLLWLTKQAGDRPKSDWMFPSPRKSGASIAKQYANQAPTRAVAKANEGRDEQIRRLTVHGLRHTFARISLSDAGADLLSVSNAMGHARPSITLDRYGHLSRKGLAPLMAKIDEVVAQAS
jgi:integrase